MIGGASLLASRWLAIPLWTMAHPIVASAPEIPRAVAAEITVAVCGGGSAEGAGSRDLASVLAAGLGATATVVAASETGEACEAARRGGPLSAAMPDLVVATSTSVVDPVRPAPRRIAFRVEGHDIVVSVLGRELTGTFTTKALVVPVAPIETPPRPQPGAGGAAAETVASDLVVGLGRALAFRRMAARRNKSDDHVRLTELQRQTALAALTSVDEEWLSSEAPATAAVVRQLRGMLRLAEACPVDSPLDLFRSAARLVPYSAEAKVLVAVARLHDAYEPSACPATAEEELFESLELNPWSNEAVDNLGLLYELSINAHPEKRSSENQLSVDVAAQRLDRVWRDQAPRAPLALELGVGAVFSSAVGQGLNEIGSAARFDVAYGRDETGWGARLGVAVPWTRQLAFPSAHGSEPWVNWTRIAFELGPRYRVRLGRFYGELDAAVLVAYAIAVGHGFDVDHTAGGVNVGGAGAVRFGRRIGRFSLWIGAGASYYVGSDSLQLSAAGSSNVASLPALDVSVLGGASAYLWR
jgi:hypothetical protein